MLRGRFIIVTVMLSMLTAVAVSTLVSAQEVRISRPLDGSTVRETVNILVPVSSVPVDGFVVYMIDKKFKSAEASKSEDGQYFVYRWDTKAPYSAEDAKHLPPHEGRHVVSAQAYDTNKKIFGPEKSITVYVKNRADSDMPAEGLKLRYSHKVGTVNKYKFEYSLNLKKIQGGTNLTALIGSDIEGALGEIKRSVEDSMPDNSALVRQKLQGVMQAYQGGRVVPAIGMQTKAQYHVEDSTGRITSIMQSASPGFAVGIDMPNLPTQRVRIGDTWTTRDKVFRNAVTGEGATLTTTNTLEGLEWQGGFPCAKIKSTFSGMMKIPFSNVFTEPISVSGETITYFAYESGKIVSSNTIAKAKTRVPSAAINSLTQSALPQGIGMPSAPSFSPSGIGGPAGMESPPSPGSMMGPGISSGGFPGATEDVVDVDLELNQIVELAR